LRKPEQDSRAHGGFQPRERKVPWARAPAALRRLRDHGFRLFTLYIGQDVNAIADQLIERYPAAARVS
jgi:hypothetical protein